MARRIGGRVLRLAMMVGALALVAEPRLPAWAQSDGASSTTSHAQFGPPILLEGSGAVMVGMGGEGFVPGKMQFGPGYFVSDTLSCGVGSPNTLPSPLTLGSCFDSGAIHWNNAIFYDVDSRQSRLMLNRRGVITRFYIPRTTPEHAPAYLLFAIADVDSSNGSMDESTPIILYVADPTGRSLTPVTPPGSRFESVTFNSTGEVLFATVHTDPQGTHRFTSDNPVAVLRVDPIHPSVGAPLWTDDLPDAAMHLANP